MVKQVGQIPGAFLGVFADILHKTQAGRISLDELSRFAKRQDPFTDGNPVQQLQSWRVFYESMGVDEETLTTLENLPIGDEHDGYRLGVVVTALLPDDFYGSDRIWPGITIADRYPPPGLGTRLHHAYVTKEKAYLFWWRRVTFEHCDLLKKNVTFTPYDHLYSKRARIVGYLELLAILGQQAHQCGRLPFRSSKVVVAGSWSMLGDSRSLICCDVDSPGLGAEFCLVKNPSIDYRQVETRDCLIEVIRPRKE